LAPPKRPTRFTSSNNFQSNFYPIDQPLVRAAAEIKSEHTLSYADAFCVATAQRLDAVVLTDDPEFESVESLIKIRWLTK
jgi:predicted nucleic acid-binding protein